MLNKNILMGRSVMSAPPITERTTCCFANLMMQGRVEFLINNHTLKKELKDFMVY